MNWEKRVTRNISDSRACWLLFIDTLISLSLCWKRWYCNQVCDTLIGQIWLVGCDRILSDMNFCVQQGSEKKLILQTQLVLVVIILFDKWTCVCHVLFLLVQCNWLVRQFAPKAFNSALSISGIQCTMCIFCTSQFIGNSDQTGSVLQFYKNCIKETIGWMPVHFPNIAASG